VCARKLCVQPDTDNTKMEIDGVPLTSMSTKQLSVLAKARGLPPMQSRAAFLNALADSIMAEGENDGDVHNVGIGGAGRVFGGEGEGKGSDGQRRIIDEDEEEVGGGSSQGDVVRDMMDGEGDDDTEGYFVGSTAFVWEDEVYTYGGLAQEGDEARAMRYPPRQRIARLAYLRDVMGTLLSCTAICCTCLVVKVSLAA